MRILVVHPGQEVSTADVEAGLVYGLQAHGVEVMRTSAEFVAFDVRMVARRSHMDAVILVTAIRASLAAIETMVAAGSPVTALFTESPYEQEKELAVARRVAGCWTHERTSVEAFRTVTKAAYLPHAWHPAVHTATPQPGDLDLPAHDVVFVGAGFRERVAFFNAIDWTGIDLGLYGIWHGVGISDALLRSVRAPRPIPNRAAAALYRRAKIGLNLYRRLRGPGPDRADNWVQADSLNPRAYELAACGCFQVSEPRAEVGEVFGYVVPTFSTPAEAAGVLRGWLAHPHQRARDRADLGACVEGSSWVDRAAQVLRDLRAWRLIEAA